MLQITITCSTGQRIRNLVGIKIKNSSRSDEGEVRGRELEVGEESDEDEYREQPFFFFLNHLYSGVQALDPDRSQLATLRTRVLRFADYIPDIVGELNVIV